MNYIAMIRSEENNRKYTGPGTLRLRAGDYIIAVSAVLISLLLLGKVFLFEKTGTQAQIVVNGEIVAIADLASGKIDEDTNNTERLLDEFSYETADSSTLIHMSSSGIHMTIEVGGGRIRFRESDCPDKVCVKTGYISVNGQVAACIPAKVLIRIIGEVSEDDPDIIIG